MKIGVVQFPGSNCERETRLALQRIGLEPVDCFWNSGAALVASLDGFVIVGGFSYEDRVRSGLIASKDPFMGLLAAEAAKGKPILGICNGAQILVESGLMGGAIALTANQRVGTGYYNDWVEIKSNRPPTNIPIRVPIAHAEGRFLLDENFYQYLQRAGALLYTYCGENPNGSMHNLAAVSNATGNIMAMMPHPERTPAGDIILKSFFEQATVVIPQSLRDSSLIKGAEKSPLWQGGKATQSLGGFKPYILNKNALHYWIALKIHDNEAISLENTLQEMGKPIALKKWVHFEVSGANQADDSVIQDSDELFNRQKEYLLQPKNTLCYMIRAFDDPIADEKQKALTKMLHKPVGIKREIVWCSDTPLDVETQAILGNPLSHEGFMYDPR